MRSLDSGIEVARRDLCSAGDGEERAGKTLVMRKSRACERPIGLAIADLDGNRRGELLATCPNENRMVVVTSP